MLLRRRRQTIIFDIFIFLLLLFFTSESFACDQLYINFLNNPTKENHKLYVDKLTLNKGRKLCEITINIENFNKLLDLIGSDNELGIDVGFRELYVSQGGNLEDTYRELGKVIERRPDLILDNIIKHKSSFWVIEKFAIMLPLTMTDNFGLQIDTTKKRMSKVESLDDNKYGSKKTVLLDFMKEHLVSLEEMKAITLQQSIEKSRLGKKQ